MQRAKSGFSVVEILIVVAIVIVLTVVAVTGYSVYQEKSYNSAVAQSLLTLDSGLNEYQESSKRFPIPDGNLKYFSSGGTYVHPGFDPDIFGISGFMTQKSLDETYIKKFPLDPRSNQYYGYATTNNQRYFQVAGILMENDEPKTLVKGNFANTDPLGVSNLVKEFAGPEFVYDESSEYFPYNPEQRTLIAHITSYTGSLKINDLSYDDATIKSYDLQEGDRVFLSTGSTAQIYYSDGSHSSLGSDTLHTDFTFANMKYLRGDNLLTQIRIALNFGKILTKVSKLGTASEFEIYTKDAIASVRGTIFGVEYDGHTKFLVEQGKVEVRKIPTPFTNLTQLTQSIRGKGIEVGSPILPALPPISQIDSKTFLIVNPGDPQILYTLGLESSLEAGPKKINGVCKNATRGGCTTGTRERLTDTTTCGTTATWKCNGANGGTSATNCSFINPACSVNAQCGSAKDTHTVYAPANDTLCVNGMVNNFKTNSCSCKYTWFCKSTSGTDAKCSANIIKNPLDNGSTTLGNNISWQWKSDTTGGQPKTYKLKNGSISLYQGTSTSFTQSSVNCGTKYTFSVSACDEKGDCTSGTTLSVSTPACSVNAQCGNSHGSSVDSKDTLTHLCQAGTASSITLDGNTFKWTCTGSPTSNMVWCSANKKINGVCGSDNGKTLTSKPTTNRCSSGDPGEVTETLKKYTWTCNGINSAVSTNCSANRILTGNGCGGCPGLETQTFLERTTHYDSNPWNARCNSSGKRDSTYCKYVNNATVLCSLENATCDGGYDDVSNYTWSGTYTGPLE